MMEERSGTEEDLSASKQTHTATSNHSLATAADGYVVVILLCSVFIGIGVWFWSRGNGSQTHSSIWNLTDRRGDTVGDSVQSSKKTPEEDGVDVEGNDDSFFSCKVYKLIDDHFDEPHEQSSWQKRDVWVSRKGVIYYFSKKEDRIRNMFGRTNIGRLTVQRLPAEQTSRHPQKCCISLGTPPSQDPSQDPNPTYLAADSEETILCILRTHEHFKQMLDAKDKSPFVGVLHKLEATSVEIRHDRDSWEESEVWFGEDGLLHCCKDQCITGLFYESIPLVRLEVNVMPPGSTCYACCASLKLNPLHGLDDEGARHSDHVDPILVAADDAETIKSLVRALDSARSVHSGGTK